MRITDIERELSNAIKSTSISTWAKFTDTYSEMFTKLMKNTAWHHSVARLHKEWVKRGKK